MFRRTRFVYFFSFIHRHVIVTDRWRRNAISDNNDGFERFRGEKLIFSDNCRRDFLFERSRRSESNHLRVSRTNSRARRTRAATITNRRRIVP